MITLNYIRGCQRLCGVRTDKEFYKLLAERNIQVPYRGITERPFGSYKQGELKGIAETLGLRFIVYFMDAYGKPLLKKTVLIDGNHIRDCYKRSGLSAVKIREKLGAFNTHLTNVSTFSAFLSRKAELYKQDELNNIAEVMGYTLVTYFETTGGTRIQQIDG